MDPLEEYFQMEYPAERREIDSIDKLIQEVWPVFVNFLEPNKGWPYEISDRDLAIVVKTRSSSTNAMILFIIAQLLGRVRENELLPSISRRLSHLEDDVFSKIRRRLRAALNIGTKILLDSVKSVAPHFSSGSFGDDDPFTYAWTLALLLDARNDPETEDALKPIILDKIEILRQTAVHRIKDAFEGGPADALRLKNPPAGLSVDRVGHATDHLFPVLRSAHLHAILLKSFPADPELDRLHNILTTNLRERFFTRLHEQLSLSAVTNASFDVAELVFAFEGYLLSLKDARAIDLHLVERVFQVLRDAQDRSAYWRPLKPFITTAQGYALLPLSVETANSLLRTCSRLRLPGTDSYFSKNIDLFRHYAAWLCTRVTRGKAALTGANETEFTGWHSEHIYVPNRIHPWETSQVLSFLLHYREILQDHVATTALTKLNVDVRPPCPIPNAPRSWSKGELDRELLKFEPLSTGPGVLSVYPTVIEQFLVPRLLDSADKTNLHHSILLYGPPGTGKSTLPEQMANVLKWPLITITPSDFIARGESEVETRAKLIFKALQEQTDKIILFDEIDRLILDRDSKYYHDQNDMFQFMTPSMLVKLKDLRSKRRSIFVIATNYDERIDSAATRKGRIDIRFLIAPPDRAKRIMIVKGELARALKQKSLGPELTAAEKVQITNITNGILDPDCAKAVGNHTVLMTYGELKQIVTGSVTMLRTVPELSVATDAAFLRTIQNQLVKDSSNADSPGIRLTTYLRRFRQEKQGEPPPEPENFPASREPLVEFLVLLYIRAEVLPEVPLSGEEHAVIERAFGRIMPEGLGSTKPVAKQALLELIKDEPICDGIIAHFPFACV